MIHFKISAPGRIILNGEYSMLYGKNVVMASINRRTRLNFVQLPDDSKAIIIKFPAINLSLRVPLENLASLSSEDMGDMVSIPIKLFSYVKYLVVSNGMWTTPEQRFSLQVFFFMLYLIGCKQDLEMKPFFIYLTTEFPIGLGFGSSSSFAICLAACFLHWARLQKGPHYAFNDEELLEILSSSICCEEIMQDYSFPIENLVCLYGKIGIFRYINPLNYYANTMSVEGMKIILIDLQSGIRPSKSERVKLMINVKHFYPNYADLVFNSSDSISRKIYKALREIHHSHGNTALLRRENIYNKLQIFIMLSQEIFRNLSILHPKLDTICSIAYDYGFVGKLTGFGFVYIFLPPDIPEEGITSLSTHLISEGFKIMTINIDCSGLRIDD